MLDGPVTVKVPFGVPVWEVPASYQLVGEVMAHLGYDE